MSRIAFVVVALAALLAGPAFAGSTMVHLYHDRVDPAEVKIAAGDTVVFHNMVEMPGGHSVVADDGSFQSPGLAKDAQWEHTFSSPGHYGFHLKEHPDTKGTVVVE